MASKVTLPAYAEHEIRQRVAASSAIEQEIIADALPLGVCLEKVLREVKFLEKVELNYLYNADLIQKHREHQRGEDYGLYGLGRKSAASI